MISIILLFVNKNLLSFASSTDKILLVISNTGLLYALDIILDIIYYNYINREYQQILIYLKTVVISLLSMINMKETNDKEMENNKWKIYVEDKEADWGWI